jgi:hypothetical protein
MDEFNLTRELCQFYRYRKYYTDAACHQLLEVGAAPVPGDFKEIIHICAHTDGGEYCSFESCPLMGGR